MTRQPVDLRMASEMQGISVEAARKRVAGGSSLTDKDQEDGRIHVYLPLDQEDERMLSLGDLCQAIIEVKDETISLLERELEMWREEACRKDHLLTALTDSLPELEPLPAPRESSLMASEGVTHVTAPPKRERSFWRRLFR